MATTVKPLYYGTTRSVLFEEVSLFQRLFCTLFHLAGTTGSVLISLFSEVLNREVPLYMYLNLYLIDVVLYCIQTTFAYSVETLAMMSMMTH